MSSEEKKTADKSSRGGSSSDPIVQIGRRNKELERRTYKALSVNIVLGLALTVSVVGNVMQGTKKPPEPRYLIQQLDGSLLPIIPLSQPVTRSEIVVQQVTDAIGALHTMDFLNYRGQLMKASEYFTRNGWNRYMDELKTSGTLAAIESRQLVVTAVVSQPPVILKEYQLGGVYAWDLQVPYKVRYVGSGYNQNFDLVAKVTVVRVPTTINPKGVAIAGYNASSNVSSSK